MGNVRDARFDTLKGVLILTVVFGHFFTHDASHGVVSESLANLIYSFHMPLFVFVSGYFTNNMRVIHGGVRLLETYIIFQLIKGIVYHYSPLWLLIMPAPMLWYLVALIFWRLLYARLEKIGVNITWHLVLIFVLTSVAVGFLPWIGREYALSRFIVFAPYFFLGVLVQKKQIVDVILKKVNFKLAVVVLVLTLMISKFFAVNSINVKDTFSGTLPYPLDNRWIYAGARLLTYVTSTVISIAFIRLFSFNNKTLGIIGKDSLKYYMFHGICLMGVEFLGFPWSTPCAVLYATTVSSAIFFFNKTRLSDFAIAPVSFFINRKKK